MADPLLDAMLNLARFHREHEKFYAQEPRTQAVLLQRHARALQALADRWSHDRAAAAVGNQSVRGPRRSQRSSSAAARRHPVHGGSERAGRDHAPETTWYDSPWDERDGYGCLSCGRWFETEADAQRKSDSREWVATTSSFTGRSVETSSRMGFSAIVCEVSPFSTSERQVRSVVTLLAHHSRSLARGALAARRSQRVDGRRSVKVQAGG